MAYKSMIMLATSPSFVSALPSKTHTTANIDVTYSIF